MNYDVTFDTNDINRHVQFTKIFHPGNVDLQVLFGLQVLFELQVSS